MKVVPDLAFLEGFHGQADIAGLSSTIKIPMGL
jgi:hypothetical protein